MIEKLSVDIVLEDPNRQRGDGYKVNMQGADTRKIKRRVQKMIKRRSIVLMLTLSLLLLVGCGGQPDSEEPGTDVQSQDPISISLGHALSEGTPASDLTLEFAENIAERTEGRVQIEVFPNSQLGSETEMLEQMQMGALEAAGIMVGSMQSLDRRMAIEDLPYMWQDIEHARAAYDGEFGEYLAGIMNEQGMQQVSYVEWGFRHITNNNKPIVTPEDMEGMTIRVAETRLRVDAFEEIGALPTIMAFSELYGALQQGVIDAQENPLANIAAANFDEVQDYLSLTGHFYNTVMVVIDNDIWDSIAEEDQAIILEEGRDLSDKVRVANDSSEEDYLQELADRGMLINDDVDTEAFREKMLPVYDQWESETFGEEMMDIYREASGW